MKRQNGFTLVELLITMAVTVLLLVAVYGAVNSIQRSSAGLERKVAAQIDIKPALDLMALEISMASFNPTFTSNLWVSPENCTSTSANQAYKGIQEATANSITVEMDIQGPSGGNPDGALGDENEVIRYSYDAAN